MYSTLMYSGADASARTISLQPPDMQPCMYVIVLVEMSAGSTVGGKKLHHFIFLQ